MIHSKLINRTNNENNNVYGIYKKINMIWIIGMVLMSLYAVISILRVKRKLQESILIKDNVYISDYARSPFVYGIFNPCIYLPSEFDDSDAVYAIAHENTHIKHKDNLWKLLAYFLLTVYWFNPFIWVAYILFNNDVECACDEATISNYNFKERKLYANALLNYSLEKSMIYVYPIFFGSSNIKKRVELIMEYKQPGKSITYASLIIIAITGMLFLVRYVDDSREISEYNNDYVLEKKYEIEIREQLMKRYDNIKDFHMLIFEENNEKMANVFVVFDGDNTDFDERNRIEEDISNYAMIDLEKLSVQYNTE